MKCTHPRQVWTIDGKWCKDCDSFPGEKRRRPLTNWERLKLTFYRSDKKWREHIANREIVYQNGKQVVLHKGVPVPHQPKELLPPPKIQYINKYGGDMSSK